MAFKVPAGESNSGAVIVDIAVDGPVDMMVVVAVCRVFDQNVARILPIYAIAS